MSVTSIIASSIPPIVVASQIVLGLLVVGVFLGKEIVIGFLKRHGLVLGFAVSSVAVLGSLFYSSILGFPPCVLCWWQRVFIFPTLILFGVALYRMERGVFNYVLPLAILAGLVAIYQAYADFGGASLLACTDSGGDCEKIFVREYGYITIPVMSLTVAGYLTLISWVNKRNG